MSKVSLSSVITLCVVLAACSETNRTVTAPGGRSSLDEAASGLAVGFTADGPLDLNFASEAVASMQAQLAAAPQAASNGRSSGHVGFVFSAPIGGVVASQDYSFTALGTSTLTPLSAKGEYEMTLTTATGRTNKVHGNVICMNIIGNTAQISGVITKLWINNVQSPILGPTHNVWTVQDNGEGQGADIVSLMQYTIAPGAAFHCTTGFPLPAFPNQEGNVQVQP